MDRYGWIEILEDREPTTEELREMLLEAINSINALTATIMGLEARIDALETTAIVLAREIS